MPIMQGKQRNSRSPSCTMSSGQPLLEPYPKQTRMEWPLQKELVGIFIVATKKKRETYGKDYGNKPHLKSDDIYKKNKTRVCSKKNEAP